MLTMTMMVISLRTTSIAEMGAALRVDAANAVAMIQRVAATSAVMMDSALALPESVSLIVEIQAAGPSPKSSSRESSNFLLHSWPLLIILT